MRAEVRVNKALCLGCGACWIVCPEVFELDRETAKAKITRDYCKEDTVDISRGDIPQILIKSVKEVVEICPSAAIFLRYIANKT